jgi:hypothetical protein
MIPEIKLIKPGYGDPNEPVGSITRLKDINLTEVVGNTYDLGNITLQSRQVIQPSVRPNGTYWPFRSIMIFPYQNRYCTEGYLETLDTLRNRLGDRFNIIDTRLPTSTDENGLPIHDDQAEGGKYSYDELACAIDGAHAKGFKVMLSRWYGPGDKDNPE